jgi:hypothetical protein
MGTRYVIIVSDIVNPDNELVVAAGAIKVGNCGELIVVDGNGMLSHILSPRDWHYVVKSSVEV